MKVKDPISAEEAAKNHPAGKVSVRRIQVLCEQGRIAGAEKLSGVWLIPRGYAITEAGRTRPRTPGKARGRRRKA